MQTNHASALRGLSIAVVIISGLAILACLICVVFVGAGGSYLANLSPEMWEYYLYDGDYYSYDYYGIDGSDMGALVALMVALGGVMMSVALVFTLPALIAGILGLRNYQNPAKMGLIFGWSLAGAICALLSGNMVTMVLLIIMCVFAYKDKQLASAQPVMVGAPVVVAEAAPQPVVPVPPVQPVQPVPPMEAVEVVQPVQPVETVEAVAVETVEAATPITEAAEPAAEPSALVQEEALEAAEENEAK